MTTTPTRLALATLAAAAATLVALPAQAQQAGHYVGTTSQGLSIDITVAQTDADGLVLTGQTTQWNEDCKTGDTKFAWWGVGAYVPLTGRSASQTYTGQSLYEKVFFHWNPAGDTVTGNFDNAEATFVDVNANHGKTEQCHSGKQTFTATLQPPVAGVAPQPAMRAGEARAVVR